MQSHQNNDFGINYSPKNSPQEYVSAWWKCPKPPRHIYGSVHERCLRTYIYASVYKTRKVYRFITKRQAADLVMGYFNHVEVDTCWVSEVHKLYDKRRSIRLKYPTTKSAAWRLVMKRYTLFLLVLSMWGIMTLHGRAALLGSVVTYLSPDAPLPVTAQS